MTKMMGWIGLWSVVLLGGLEAKGAVLLRARWTEGGEKYLYDMGDVAGLGSAPAGDEFLWEVEEGKKGWIRLRNSKTGDYLGDGGMASCVDQEAKKSHDWRQDQLEEGWVRLLNQGEKAYSPNQVWAVEKVE